MSEIDRVFTNRFLQACQNANLDKVKTLANQYRINNWTAHRHSATGDTALHVAAREGNIDVVKYLCEDWTEPEYIANVANFDMKRPLHEAAQFARSDVLQYLIQQAFRYFFLTFIYFVTCANVDALKRADWTPLMLACTKKGNEAQSCINILLKSRANLFLRNKDGWTPFLLASRAGDPLIVSQLLKHSAECINDISNNRRTPLHIAAFHGCHNILDVLLTAKPDLLHSRDSAGSTPLHESVKSLNFKVTEYLLKQGANIKVIDGIGQNILHIAASIGNTNVITYILSHNIIHIETKDHFGITPLKIAERNNQIEVIQILLKN